MGQNDLIIRSNMSKQQYFYVDISFFGDSYINALDDD